jgi:geranylgeranyl diphosphate synthase type II
MDAPDHTFRQFADDVRLRIDAELDRYCQLSPDCPTRLRDAFRHSLFAPGKRLRPMLVLCAASACGSNTDRALPAACAVEMVHTYSLIHDDLPAMDNDSLRRGRLTCHIAFDEATAILAGDGLLTLAFEVLAEHVRPGDVAARCCAVLAKAAGFTGMVGGQADDLMPEHGQPEIGALERIHRRKTGALLTASLCLGALTAAATDEQIERLTAYGNKLGLAFQIVDDLLDLRGDSSTLGKTAGKDAHQGKLTFPVLLGEAESHRRARALIDQAIVELHSFGDKADNLVSLAKFVLERDR